MSARIFELQYPVDMQNDRSTLEMRWKATKFFIWYSARIHVLLKSHRPLLCLLSSLLFLSSATDIAIKGLDNTHVQPLVQ